MRRGRFSEEESFQKRKVFRRGRFSVGHSHRVFRAVSQSAQPTLFQTRLREGGAGQGAGQPEGVPAHLRAVDGTQGQHHLQPH